MNGGEKPTAAAYQRLLHRLQTRDLLIPMTCLLCPLILGLFCFAPVLLSGRQFGFRDGSSFYYPFYQRVQQEWAAGRLPLWEPEENGGMPLLGNPTAAVLYPGKLIFAVMSYACAARWYVIAHVLLACLSMFWLLRSWKIGISAATFGALAYAYGAPVLLQYSNVIFLVGAAWMPLGLYAADRWLSLGSPRALVALAIVLALQALGGDPQAAYITLLAALIHAVSLSIAERSVSSSRRWLMLPLVFGVFYVLLYGQSFLTSVSGNDSGSHERPQAPGFVLALWMLAALVILIRFWRNRSWGLELRLLGLGVAGVLGILIAAVQVVPSVEFFSRSMRVAQGNGEESIYILSYHPASIVELVWPGFFGYLTNRSLWLPLLPSGQFTTNWTESVYLGGLTVFLGLVACRRKHASARQRWLISLMVTGALLSVGFYASPGFWARVYHAKVGLDLQEADVADLDVGLDGAGSPYWFLATILPGFGSFRFPGKFSVLASLGLSGLAAIGFDGLGQESARRFLRSIGVITGVLSLVLLVFVFSPPGKQILALVLEGKSPEQTAQAFGPISASAVQIAISQALLRGLLVGVLAVGLATVAARRPDAVAFLLVLGLTLDLGLNNWSLIHSVPQSLFEHKPQVLETIERAEAHDPSSGPYRIHRMNLWSPAVWRAEHSSIRQEEIVRWQRDTVYPKYAIPYGYSYTFALGTTEWLDQWRYFTGLSISRNLQSNEVAEATGGKSVWYHKRRAFDLWNTRYFILPARLAVESPYRGFVSFLPDTTQIDPPPQAFDGPDGQAKREEFEFRQDVQVLRNDSAYPRAWVVHRARFSKPIQGPTLEERLPIMNEILYEDDEFLHVDGRPVYDPRTLAWIEAEPSDRPGLLKQLSGALPDPEESVHVDKLEPQRVELTANLKSAGLVILADIYYPGWELTVDGVPTPVERVNRAMRGAFVSAGTHKLTYVYRPISVKLGAVLSALGIVLSLVLMYYGAGGVDKVFRRRKTLPLSNPDSQ